MTVRRAARRFAWLLTPLCAGCEGIQSALQPAGPSAREIAALWWSMAAGSAVILMLVVALLFYAVFSRPQRRHGRRLTPTRLIVYGGIVLPVIVLSILVPFNIWVAAGISAPRAADTLTVRVHGRQWWWQIEYDDGTPNGRFDTANEIYLPVGARVELLLTTADVIHSLWIPRLAGKIDMIPGRTNRLMIEADEPGIFRGQCAEFCGLSHAKMALHVVAVEADEFQAWLERQRADALPPATDPARDGAALFDTNGCGLCHTVRGHGAWGVVGPDLTHVGGRLTIGAGLLTTTPDHLAAWIAHNEVLKPGNLMPAYVDLDRETRIALGAYLEGLR